MGDIEEHYEKVAEIPPRYKLRNLSHPEIVTFLVEIDLANYVSNGDSALEIGCGDGNFLIDLRNKFGAKVTGLDIQRPVNLADIHFVRGPAEAMPFEDNSFDFAFSYFSFQYIPDKLKALRETHRVLKMGGRAIIDFGHLYCGTKQLVDMSITPSLKEIVSEYMADDQVNCEGVWVFNNNDSNPRKSNRVVLTKKTSKLRLPELQHFRTREGNFPFAYSYY